MTVHSVPCCGPEEAPVLCCPLGASGTCELTAGGANAGKLGGQRQTYAAGQTLWAESEEPCCVPMVLSGLLRLERFDIDGNRRVLGVVLPGEFAGITTGLADPCGVSAAIDTELCMIDRRRFRTRMETDPDFRLIVARQIEARLERLRWITWSLGALSASERIAGFLAAATRMMPYEPQPDGTGILTLSLPRPDIADYLGTTVETISRVTQSLHRSGQIEIIDPRHFRICDIAGLARRGGVEDTFMKLPVPSVPGGGVFEAA